MTDGIIGFIKKHVPRRTIVWWFAILVTMLLYDLLWAMETSYNHFTYISLYVNLVTATFVLGVPSAYWRRIWPQALMLIAYDCLLEANLMYCRTYFLAIPLDNYAMAGNLADFHGSVIEALRVRDVLLFVPAVVAIFVSIPRKKGPSKRFRLVYTLLTLVSVSASVALLVACGGFVRRLNMMSECVNQATCVAPVYTIPGQLLYDAMTGDAQLTAADSAAVTSFIASTPPAPGFAVAPRRNVVMVMCESLESWPIGLEVDGHEVTPAINAMVAEPTTLYRPAMVTQVGAGRSIDAQLMMLAGLLPPSRGVWSTRYAANSYPSLVDALRQSRGELTATIMTLDTPGTWNQAVVARNLGFDRMVMRDDWQITSPDMLNVDGKPLDSVLLRQGLQRLDTLLAEGNNFVLMVTATGHNPFVISEKAAPRSYDSASRPKILNDYLAVTTFLDAELGRFVDELKRRAWWDETTVIIAGDHEGLAAHRKALSEGFDMVDPGRHTPFIVLNSPCGGGSSDREAGQVDIYTTLLDMLGAGDYYWRGVGVDMVDTVTPRPRDVTVSDIIIRGDMLKH